MEFHYSKETKLFLLWLWKFIYVCMYMHACMYVDRHARDESVCMYVCNVCMCAGRCVWIIFMYVYAYIHMQLYRGICTHACMSCVFKQPWPSVNVCIIMIFLWHNEIHNFQNSMFLKFHYFQNSVISGIM